MHSKDSLKINNKSKYSPGFLTETSQLHPLRSGLTREAVRAAGLGSTGWVRRGHLDRTHTGSNLPGSFSSPTSATSVKIRFCWYNEQKSMLRTSCQHSCVGQRSHTPSKPWLRASLTKACDVDPLSTPVCPILCLSNSPEISRVTSGLW